MKPEVCEALRKAYNKTDDYSRKQEAARVKAEQDAAKARKEMAEAQAQRNAQKAAYDAAFEARYKREQDEAAARKLAYEQEAQREDAAEARREADNAAFLRKKRKECGADFQTPRVGMTLARAQQCVGTLRMVSEAASVNGVVATYRVGPYHLTFKGKALALWVRY